MKCITVPSSQHSNSRIFDSHCWCCSRRSYAETVASKVIIWKTCFFKRQPDVPDKLCFRERLPISEFKELTFSSPALRKPKKQRSDAAHKIQMSMSCALGAHCSWSFSNIAGVMGNLTFGDREWLLVLSTPAWTNFNRGSDENSRGSGNPSVICVWRTPAN